MIRSNFTAELHSQHGQVLVTSYGTLGTKSEVLLPLTGFTNGWLCHHPGKRNNLIPMKFHFEYIRSEENRVIYQITAGETLEFKWARLDKDNADRLGLYGTGLIGRITDNLSPVNVVKNTLDLHYWKVQPLEEWDGDINSADKIDFYLRDKYGYRVAVANDRANTKNLYAGSADGEILRFRLRNIEVE
ncbi:MULTISPECIES: hypothetical protein [unclassified Pseudomonas]|jgi:hypothetical protein|uniref:hypothetical protein n=1 Tax=unclassified Pseudomonas TaxID=196821 RepID=UPI0004823F54|nr:MULTISPECIES: hypothetical protein [unclassified Pseudomonas]RAS31649.1 hypothetical protein H040_00939 [Pseudomonas sp. URMO17WK12:I7]SMF08425.1 hypothetical protein SAMN02745903_01256 [Pseudomonas sp. URMO17WK12:I5]